MYLEKDMSMKINEKDREKIISEISECQGRILQTLVPTIIAIGLISIADREEFALITSVTAFSVLFGTSVYVASLSYKIFRNSSFIRALTDRAETSNTIYWEEALSKFNKYQSPPAIIGYETRTIAVVYLVFSLTYTYMFYEIYPLVTTVLGFVLATVALRILFIPNSAETYHRKWTRVLDGYKDSSDKKQQT
jgi:hypothetical protein